MSILILDTETTGKNEPQAIEIAFLDIHFPTLEVKSYFQQYYKPNKAIELGATATHHILIEDLQNMPSSGEFDLKDTGCEYLIGHNIDYDWKVLGELNVKRIDTLALARYLLPDLDSHTQSALLYYFTGRDAREVLRYSHSALADVKICSTLLDFLLDIISARLDITRNNLTIEELYLLSEQARVPKIFTFGKHKGEIISDVKKFDPGYISWMLRQADIDEYLRKALQA